MEEVAEWVGKIEVAWTAVARPVAMGGDVMYD